MMTATTIVIGHVDHGKTSLVRALTGVETDRLAEEKARGLSIALGFAPLETNHGIIDLIDAPGHADFLKTMVSGATGATSALLVVSAVDGPSTQTWEHLEIAAHLGVARIVIAVSQIDRLPAGSDHKAIARIKDAFVDSPAEHAPIVATSILTGAGLDALASTLGTEAFSGAEALGPSDPVLAIDRVFTVDGTGTVLTGTLLGGALAIGDAVCLGQRRRTAIIRGIQARGSEQQEVAPIQRVAVALRGISRGEVRRGDTLTLAPGLDATDCLDATVQLSNNPNTKLCHMDRVALHIGTTRVTAQVLRLDGGNLNPGQEGLVQLRLEAPQIVFPGQRGLIRAHSPAATLGGIEVLLPASPRARGGDPSVVISLAAIRDRDPDRTMKALASRLKAPIQPERVTELVGRAPSNLVLMRDYVRLEDGLVHGGTLRDARESLLQLLVEYHERHPHELACRTGILLDALARAFGLAVAHHTLRVLVEDGLVARTTGRIALALFDPADALSVKDRAALSRIETALAEGGTNPPGYKALVALGGPTDRLLGILIASGRLRALRNRSLGQVLFFHADALSDARRKLDTTFGTDREFRTAEARDCLGATRRGTVPILEYFDRVGVTERRGDIRWIAAPLKRSAS
ncbi:SelB C-terminal domain-containing protein [uncultured Tateyamaria sp.]|uniref:selenocysteine-specific translation elongation factor n=1 Tax=uncultured Tateyamaria sp. TaxID=455651 RepID=UPI00261662A2|nr:selenocysteine-specific translation elongation factor [uncultured Tateyamaria sp.]